MQSGPRVEKSTPSIDISQFISIVHHHHCQQCNHLWSKRMTSKSQRVIWIFLRQFLLYSTFCIQKPPSCLQKPIIEGSDAHLWNGKPLPTFQVYTTSISSTQNCTSLVFLVPTITWLWSWKWMILIISFSNGWKKCMLDVPMHDVYTLP